MPYHTGQKMAENAPPEGATEDVPDVLISITMKPGAHHPEPPSPIQTL